MWSWHRLGSVSRWPVTVAVAITGCVCLLVGAIGLLGVYRLDVPRRVDAAHRLALTTGVADVTRGEHLAYLCVRCHSASGNLPLTGGTTNFLSSPQGTFGELYAPNLTPRGRIREWSDGEVARAIREGVDSAGRPLLAMPASNSRLPARPPCTGFELDGRRVRPNSAHGQEPAGRAARSSDAVAGLFAGVLRRRVGSDLQLFAVAGPATRSCSAAVGQMQRPSAPSSMNGRSRTRRSSPYRCARSVSKRGDRGAGGIDGAVAATVLASWREASPDLLSRYACPHQNRMFGSRMPCARGDAHPRRVVDWRTHQPPISAPAACYPGPASRGRDACSTPVSHDPIRRWRLSNPRAIRADNRFHRISLGSGERSCGNSSSGFERRWRTIFSRRAPSWTLWIHRATVAIDMQEAA